MFVVQSNIWVNIVFFFFFHLDRMGIVKRLWINCAAKNSIFMDRLSAACEKTILFASFFVIRTNGYNTVCSLLTLSLFLNTNKKLAITLYRRRHKSNSRKYWKSGAEMEVDQIGWGKMWLHWESKLQHLITNYVLECTEDWSYILNQRKRLWRRIHLFGQKSVMMLPGPVYVLNHKIFCLQLWVKGFFECQC